MYITMYIITAAAPARLGGGPTEGPEPRPPGRAFWMSSCGFGFLALTCSVTHTKFIQHIPAKWRPPAHS